MTVSKLMYVLCSITQLLPHGKGHSSPHFLAHVYCGQTAGWIRIPLGTDVQAAIRGHNTLRLRYDTIRIVSYRMSVYEAKAVIFASTSGSPVDGGHCNVCQLVGYSISILVMSTRYHHHHVNACKRRREPMTRDAAVTGGGATSKEWSIASNPTLIALEHSVTQSRQPTDR